MSQLGTASAASTAKRPPAAAGGLGAALAALESAAPGIGVGIRLVGHDDRTRRLGNPAMNAALAAGLRFDDCGVLADLMNGHAYKRLSVLVDEPAAGLTMPDRIALVSTGLEVLSRLDNLGSASAAA